MGFVEVRRRIDAVVEEARRKVLTVAQRGLGVAGGG